MTQYNCGACNWSGKAEEIDGINIPGRDDMPHSRRDLGYDCPNCSAIIGAVRMKPEGNGEYSHYWEDMSGTKID